jgi:exonuclease SbcC
VQRHKSIQNEIEQLKTPLQKAQHDFNHIEQQYTAEKIVFENIEAEQKQQNQFEIQHQDSIKLIRERIAERLVLVDQLRKAQSDFKEIENQLTPHLNHENQLKLQLEQLKNKIAQHTAQLECSKHFASIDDGLSAHLSQLQRFIQSYAQFEKTYGDVQHANLQCKAQQKQLDELTQQFGQDEVLHQKITSLRNERDQLLQQFSQFKVIQPQWQNFKHIDAEQRQLIDSYNTLNQQILEHQATFDSAEKDYQEQKIAREQLQKILQQQRLLNTENLEKLRSELVDGEACLVCGSTHHPYVEQANFSDELLKLQEQQEQQAVASEKLAFDTWQKQQTVLTELRASLNANQQHRANLGLQQQALQAELESQLTSLNIKFDFSQAHEALTQLLETQNHTMLQAQKQLEDSLASHEKVQKLRQTLATSIQHTTQHLSNVQQAENNIQHIISLLNDSEKYDWQQATLKTAEQIYHGLQQRQQTSKQLHDLTTQYNQTQQQFEQCTQQVKFSQEKIQSAEKAIEALKISGKKNTDIAIQAILDMTQITVEKPHEWLAEFEQQILQLKDKIELARQQFNQVRQSFDNAQSILNKCLTENTQLHKQAEQSNVQIQQWLEQNTEFNHALLEQLSTVSHEQEQQLKQRISAVERTYADLQAGIKTVQNQLKEHLAHQPNIAFEVLTSTLSALAENLRTLAEQRDELKLKLEVHQRNLAKQQQFAEQIQQIQTEEHRWNKISSLMGDATGKKFRDLAQQYNLDILIEYANQQLAMLSQRYTLKRLENSLSLAIVDHDMDGETRSVSSLSGGESFLTALALSLAIASMASGTTKIESLFIDEGFGTLDASSLHMVMNALDQLQHQGRKVVLISHIQEMHERIPVQIQVNPMGAGASTIQVVS